MAAALALFSPVVLAAQQPSVPTPGALPAAATVSTAPVAQKQPAVADALNLPESPAPQSPSPAAAAVVTSIRARDLGHGTYTAASTGQPLQLTLDDAVRLALQYNLTVAVDEQNGRQIRGLQLTALNALIPSLTASAETDTKEINLAAMGFDLSTIGPLLPPGVVLNTIVKVDTTSARINLNQQLFNLPAYEVYKASKVTAEVERYNTLGDRGQIVLNVAGQYLRVLADTASIQNAESQLQSDRELERQAREKKDAGVGTNLDLIRARVERQNREQQLIASTGQFEKDKVQLNRLMGLAADQPLQLVDAVPYHQLESLPLDQAKQVAYKRRKDLLSLQSQLHVAELQRRAVAYERLPVVRVGGFYGVLGQTRGLYHGVFTAQGGLDFPLFQEAQIRGDREVADSQLSSLRSQLGSLRGDIEQQIRSAMLDVTTTNELVRDATSNVDLAAEALDETTQRFRAGIDDTLPVVRAQATLANAQAQLVSSLYQFNSAKLQLARYIGVIESQYDSYLND